jgi:hypothetical protein
MITSAKQRSHVILIGASALLILVAAFAPAIPQDPAFHLFADIRLLCGIPRFGDVVSNIPIAMAGLAGLWGVTGARSRALFEMPSDGLPYRVFYAAVAMIGLGSGYYHWEPSTGRLFWDRLPMTVAFMAFFAAFIADRIDRRVGIVWVLPIAVALGIASLVYWSWSESIGRGDLRAYALIQFGPMLILPLIALLFRDRRLTDGRYLAGVLVVYGLAIVAAFFDYELLDLTRGVISGHSLKHLIAACACVIPLAMLRRRR